MSLLKSYELAKPPGGLPSTSEQRLLFQLKHIRTGSKEHRKQVVIRTHLRHRAVNVLRLVAVIFTVATQHTKATQFFEKRNDYGTL